jgi:hypothetical protein
MSYLYGDRTYGVGHYGWLHIAVSVGGSTNGSTKAINEVVVLRLYESFNG